MTQNPEQVLREADTELQTLHDDLTEHGRSTVDVVSEAYDEFTAILDRYEDRATDRDDFQGYIEFREKLSEQLASLPDDLPHRDAFEAADEELTTGVTSVLKPRNFDRARGHLEPARELAELRDEWAETKERYRSARSALQRNRSEREDEVNELTRIQELGAADLDAPVELIHEPIDAYNDAVREAFESFKRSTSAREVLDLVADTTAYPLVGFRPPPDNLRRFLADSPAGDESISRLLDLADYSTSKLDHYVADPQAFRANVATNRTYLATLDASPLCVSWPPESADALRFRLREYIAVVGRFAVDDVVALARDVRECCRRSDFEELRTSASAQADLTAEERARLRDGSIDRELAAARDERDAIDDVLAAHPPLAKRF
ncbi:hypothetical protein ACFQH3_07350 [Haladaptatus sp. GCM10025707]|uniref:DUF7118 family protein n=1 Tax=unclassified Haladaptatus TaxID=2622732 RepID=UPI0023E804F0|nr:hypothetical protein [Haladaptatus sp. QDMS2]